MQLLIVRHAPAEDRGAAWPDDALRPLTARGIERFRAAARGLATLVPPPVAILSSPYVRTWQTAEILAAEATWLPPTRCDALGSGGDLTGVLAAVEEVTTAGLVVIVGHAPDVGMLASLLLTGDPEAAPFEWKKGTAGLLDLPAGVHGPGTLQWLLPPKALRALQ
ncbi:MAG: histidine phosphatase family protein [Chloroflexi bacterium]|nr:histidine phosphatase family protein [Chloroflexota bacterium]MDA1240696.1 histidine phosphatase family protein [Chloroflexota bacterium]